MQHGWRAPAYWDRFHLLYMTVNVGKPFPNIDTVLLDTRFFRNERNQHFVGNSSYFANDDRNTLRFDPEGVRVSKDGNFFVSDEYGPYLFKFNRQGHLIKRIPVPEKFLIANPTDEVDDDGNSKELYPENNTFGRQANRGMEGLAITPDGQKLVGMMQNALIQDNGLNDQTPPGRRGRTRVSSPTIFEPARATSTSTLATSCRWTKCSFSTCSIPTTRSTPRTPSRT